MLVTFSGKLIGWLYLSFVLTFSFFIVCMMGAIICYLGVSFIVGEWLSLGILLVASKINLVISALFSLCNTMLSRNPIITQNDVENWAYSYEIFRK